MSESKETQTLLTAWVRYGCEASFGKLVTNYSGLVYGTAMRATGGRSDLAPDIAQRVFVDLANKAARLAHDERLGLWLHKRTRWAAADALRSERRRQNRETLVAMEENLIETETQPWEQWAPELDAALARLPKRDRQAIVLRFMEGRRLAAVGEAMGVGEEAARKRVTRALDKLRSKLLGRGVAFSAAGLLTALSAESAKAAPTGSAATWTSASVAGKATGLTALLGRSLVPAGSVALGAAIATSVILPLSAVTEVEEHPAVSTSIKKDAANNLNTLTNTTTIKPARAVAEAPSLSMDDFVRALIDLSKAPPSQLKESRMRALMERLEPGIGLELGEEVLAKVHPPELDDLIEPLTNYWRNRNPAVTERALFEFLVNEWPSDPAHRRELGQSAGAWGERDPSAALAWLEQPGAELALRRASGNQNFKRTRSDLVIGIARGIGSTEGEEAKLDFLIDAINAEQIDDIWLAIGSSPAKGDLTAFAGIESPEIRGKTMNAIARNAELHSPGSGRALIDNLPASEERSALAFRITQQIFSNQFHGSKRYNDDDWAPLLNWAIGESSGTRQPYEVAALVERWAKKGDQARLTSWLTANPKWASDPIVQARAAAVLENASTEQEETR